MKETDQCLKPRVLYEEISKITQTKLSDWFVNLPYSLTSTFISKAALEYRKIKNLVLIIPSLALITKAPKNGFHQYGRYS
jgi:hypothetical protein